MTALGRYVKPKEQARNIDELSQAYDLDDNQRNLLRSSGLWSYNDLTKYVNELLTQQYQTEDERRYNEGLRDEQREYDEQEISRMRAHGLNPDLLGVSGESSAPIQGSGSIYGDNPLSKALSGGSSLSESFNSVLGNVLKLAAFGVSSFGTISNVLMDSGLKVAGMALTDLPSFSSGEDNLVDVEKAIAQGLASRGLRPGSRKASIYASTIAQHVNSLPAILKRAQFKGAYNTALYEGKVSAFKASDDYTQKVISALDLAEDTKVKLAEYDAEIAKQKALFIKEHPEYTADSLEAALSQQVEGARKAKADADDAEVTLAGHRLDNSSKVTQLKIDEEKLKQEQTQTGVAESDAELRKLKNSIEQIRIEGFDAMIDFCRKYEEDSYNAGVKHSPEWNAWHAANEKRTRRYVEYRKQLRKAGYYKDHRLKLSGGIKAGPINTSVGN